MRGHWYTIAPHLGDRWNPVPRPPSKTHRLEIDDPMLGKVRIRSESSRAAEDGSRSDALVIIVHGLGGHPDRPYCCRAAHAVLQAGADCLRVGMRGSDRDGEDIYHGGLTEDLHTLLASEATASYEHVYLLGFSLGGHIVLRAATEDGIDSRVTAAASISAPLDLAACQRSIDRPGAWIYRRYVLRSLKNLYSAVSARGRGRSPMKAVMAVRSLQDFDDLVVSQRFGFAGASDYYAKASVAQRIDRLKVPCFLLCGLDDPMVPREAVLPYLDRGLANLGFHLEKRGGHVGFSRELDLGFTAPKGRDAQVVAWLLSQKRR